MLGKAIRGTSFPIGSVPRWFTVFIEKYLVVFLFWEQTAKNMPETKSGRLCFGHAAFGLF